MNKYIRKTLCILCFFCFNELLYSQNEDTPNLSFENGNFEGWTLYSGEYYYDKATDKYIKDWTIDPSLNRIRIMNSIGTQDPIVSCSDFLENPDGGLVARIGVPLKTEACDAVENENSCTDRLKDKEATEERMTYSFRVTEKTTL